VGGPSVSVADHKDEAVVPGIPIRVNYGLHGLVQPTERLSSAINEVAKLWNCLLSPSACEATRIG